MNKDSQKSKKAIYLYIFGFIILIGLIIYMNYMNVFSIFNGKQNLVDDIPLINKTSVEIPNNIVNLVGGNIPLINKTSFKIPNNIKNLIDIKLHKF